MSKPTSTTLDEEVREKVQDRKAYVGVIERLSKASVDKHWDAYADIPWNDPEFSVDPDDPRWILPQIDRLGSTAWYREQPPNIQAQIGLWRVATTMKIGLQFENLLKRGLLTYAYKLPNGSPEFRYVLHETTEECHHSMMFQEFVNRTKMPIKGMPKSLDLLSQIAPHIPRLSTRAVLRVRARRRGPDRLLPAADHQERPRTPPAAGQDHAHPHRRGGAAHLLRPPLPQAPGAAHQPGTPQGPRRLLPADPRRRWRASCSLPRARWCVTSASPRT